MTTRPASPPPAPAGQPGPSPAPAAPRALGGQLAMLAFDIGAPVALYYILRSAGLSSFTALLVSAVPPGLAAAGKLAIKRHVDTVALVVLATIFVSVCLSAAVHSPRFLLARDGLITALWGGWFLATLAAARPAAYTFARPLMEGRRALGMVSWEFLWRAEPGFRRIWQAATVIWAAGLLADAIVRVVMSYTLPVDVVPGLGGALWPVTFVVIQVITNIYYHRAGLYRMLREPGQPG
ncbi:MAG TPA: VC0807 family protein [Streptosporangiaceae bacterium]|nr:VC0807 family protein [Streptosporangiaceae bacterium]